MPKRKFDEFSVCKATPNIDSDKALRLQRHQIEGLLEQGKKALFQSLKVTRGFERQKLSRRQKTAKSENAEAERLRLEAEVAALKKLELEEVAEIHLYKSLLKIKTVATAPSFPKYVQATVERSRKPLDAASANVQARLFKFGPAQTTITDTINKVCAILKIEEVKLSSKKRLRAGNYRKGTLDKNSRDGALLKQNKQATKSEEEWNGFPDPDLEQESNNDENRNPGSDDEDYDRYASRLITFSNEDSADGNSNSEGSHNGGLNPQSITEDDSSCNSLEEDSFPISVASKNTATVASPGSTTFLPSLSLGGYWSGSDSAETLSNFRPQPRKNRRGQQARRAIWEKKYGKTAKHLKKQPQNRDAGWDSRRGATAGNSKEKKGRGRGDGGYIQSTGSTGEVIGGRSMDRGSMGSGANSDPVNVRKSKPGADAPLHPSWEAAKKVKELKKAVHFQGKKVVFD